LGSVHLTTPKKKKKSTNKKKKKKKKKKKRNREINIVIPTSRLNSCQLV